MLSFLGKIQLPQEELVICDPMINRINTACYGIPIQQQKKLSFKSIGGYYSLYRNDEGDYLLMAAGIHSEDIVIGSPKMLSASFSRCFAISSAKELYDSIRVEPDYLPYARFDASRMYDILLHAGRISVKTIKSLYRQATSGMYPFVSQYNDPAIAEHIGDVPNTSWAECIIDMCRKYKNSVFAFDGGAAFGVHGSCEFAGCALNDRKGHAAGIVLCSSSHMDSTVCEVTNFLENEYASLV